MRHEQAGIAATNLVNSLDGEVANRDLGAIPFQLSEEARDSVSITTHDPNLSRALIHLSLRRSGG